MSILTDIATYLAASGLGVYDPTGTTSTIFDHALPDAPPAALGVLAYGHGPTGPYLFDDTLPLHENPRLQILVRDPDADTCHARCYAAWKALIGLSDVALGGIHYFCVRSVNGPVGLQRDENNLWLYAANVTCMKVFS